MEIMEIMKNHGSIAWYDIELDKNLLGFYFGSKF